MGLEGVELIMAIEEEFGVEMPNTEAEEILTPRDLMNWLHAQRSAEGFFNEKVLAKRQSWLATMFGRIPTLKEKQRVQNLSRVEIEEAVRRIIREQLGVVAFADTDRFVEDLGMD